MANCIVNEKINNDFLSQSYSQGIERITGTKDSTCNFQIPKELLEIRKKTWDNLFDKYSKEMSDDIELNVDTLEPEEEEKEKTSEEEYSYGQRVPMRKPATLVQYWINTGNPPYKALLEANELSETGSSLSEKEIISLSSLVTNGINAGHMQKYKNDSSYSSVDTAAYIISNANVTKKANTVAIIKNAKCVKVKSLKEVAIKDIGVPCNDKIEYMETSGINCEIMHNKNDNVNVDVTDSELCPMSTEYVATEVCDMAANTLASSNAIQSNMYSQNLFCEETDKIDEFNISQKHLDVQTIDDIASIFQQFDKTSKGLIANNKNYDVSDLNQDKVLEVDFHDQVSKNVMHEIIDKNTSPTPFHRKKLYTGRDSPVDLMLTETHGTNRLSGAKQNLHPALDSNGTIKKKFLTHKGKNKHLPSTKRNLYSKKIKRKEKRELDCISNKIITDINKYANDNREIQNSIIDSSFKSLSDDNLDKQDIPFKEYNDVNISLGNAEFSKQNLVSLNLQPVVLLERIKSSFNRCKLDENTYIAQKENVCKKNRHLNIFKKLYCKNIEKELETMDSDESTILLCQCNRNVSQCVSSSDDSSLDLRLNDFSASHAERKDDKLLGLKNIDVSQNKKLHVEGLPQLSKKDYTNAAMESQISNKNNAIRQNVLPNESKTYSHLYERNEMNNVKLREIKIILERLPLSVKNCANTMMEMQVLNEKNAVVWQKEISNKSKTHFLNPYEKDNVKLREIKVVLERLPANICLKKSSNITNIFHNKKKISQNISSQTNHKQESKIRKISQILAYKNGAEIRPVRNNYSKMNIKKNNDKMSDTYDFVIESSRSQVFDKIESELTFQHKTFRHKSRRKTSQDNCSKFSVLTFTSSDEDDFVRSIQQPKKKSKISFEDILDESNIAKKDLCNQTKLIVNDKDKYCYSRNLSTVIRSSEKIVQRDIGSMKEKRKHNRVVEIKSFNSNTRTNIRETSLEKHRNEKFVFFSSKDNNDSVTDNSNNVKEKIVFFDSKENTSNNNLRRSNGAIKKNKINLKDNAHAIIFQTKIFDTSSSDSEESSS